MTRLILVHGINQENTDREEIIETWIDSLRAAAGKNQAWADALRARAEAPYYGKLLAAHADGGKKSQTIAQGVDDAPDDFSDFAADALREMAIKAGATPAQIEAETGAAAVAQGAGPHKEWVKGLARVIENISPIKGRLAVRILKQAHVYLMRENVAEDVDNAVRPALDGDEPAVIVAHSLGTIVTYKLLREFARKARPRQSPLYVTLGSPLGIDVVRKQFKKPRNRPADVARWINGADPEDFVALRAVLDKDSFGPGAENIPDIDNGKQDPHSITDYLSDKRIADAVAAHFP